VAAHLGRVVAGDQHVGRLEVEVRDRRGLRVQVVHAGGDADGDLEPPPPREAGGGGLPDDQAQRAPGNELGDLCRQAGRRKRKRGTTCAR
jgi:hypothetical protein